MKKIIFALCALLVFSCSSHLIYQAGIQKGTEDGYNKGYAEGIESGKEAGYNNGYVIGYSQAKKDSVQPGSKLTEQQKAIADQYRPSEADLAKKQNVMVYITVSGSKYHKNGCQYLRSSKIAINKNTAIARGYSACSVCW